MHTTSLRSIAIPLGVILLSALYTGNTHASCSGSFCSINTDWNEHGPIRSGWFADLRYNYNRADTLRSGSNKITTDTDPAADNQRSNNQLVTATLDYTYDDNWGAILQLPYVMRDHTRTIDNPDPALVSRQSLTANAMGDIRLLGRYRWELADTEHSIVGFKFGLKLNNGRKDFQLIDAAGKLQGVPQEMALQPGNGSTDMIGGIFWNQNTPGSNWSWFAQSTAQESISSSNNLRPGTQINLDAGTSYAFTNKLRGLLQLNGQWNATDTHADHHAAHSTVKGDHNSGGTFISLTPGLSYNFTATTQMYGLLQQVLYQYVNGKQFTADASYSLGILQRF